MISEKKNIYLYYIRFIRSYERKNYYVGLIHKKKKQFLLFCCNITNNNNNIIKYTFFFLRIIIMVLVFLNIALRHIYHFRKIKTYYYRLPIYS